MSIKINKKKYIETYINIKNKSGDIVPFKLNHPQKKLYEVIKKLHKEKKPIRILVLKARQMGFSTFTGGLFTADATTKFNRNTMIVSHTAEATKGLFNMYGLMVKKLPKQLQPATIASNAQEIVFNTKDGEGLGSAIRCLTAGSKGLGRGSTIHNLHLSEYAWWENNKAEQLNGLMQTVPGLPDTTVIIESTANGFDHFKELWDNAVRGENSWYPFFCAWWEMEEYVKTVEEDFTLTKEEEDIKKRFNLSNEQIAWRRWKIKEMNGDINLFNQEYPDCPETAFISTGECVFDKSKIIERITELEKHNVKPIKRGYFRYNKQFISEYQVVMSDIEFVSDEKGCIRIYEEPIENKPYVIGGDTAGSGADAYTAQVIDNITEQQVAVYEKVNVDDDLYAEQMYCLGKYYNDALIGIETNFSTVPTLHLEKLNYQNMYLRQRQDTITKQMENKLGFLTTRKTKPIIISGLVEIVRDNINAIMDIPTLRQLLTFVKNDNGSGEAQQGEHDDLVMALAIAYGISGQQRSALPETPQEKTFLDMHFNLNKKRNDGKGSFMKW